MFSYLNIRHKNKYRQAQHVIDCHKKLDIPADFSFLKIAKPADILTTDPREVAGKYPREVCDGSDGLFKTSSIRLNNNQLTTLVGFKDVLWKILVQPEAIKWIDLSCNKLPSIDPVLATFPKLSILYLHANQIEKPKDVDVLKKCPSLRRLTLHNNPMDQLKDYRLNVLTKLPQLSNLDSVQVTGAERKTADFINSLTSHPMKGKMK